VRRGKRHSVWDCRSTRADRLCSSPSLLRAPATVTGERGFCLGTGPHPSSLHLGARYSTFRTQRDCQSGRIVGLVATAEARDTFIFHAPLRLHFGTTSDLLLAGRSLPESCPRNGDLPKSPFPHWQQRCHRLAQSYLTVDSGLRCAFRPQHDDAQLVDTAWSVARGNIFYNARRGGFFWRLSVAFSF
jgi:hypothetical protein